jgi:CHASE1-domain containing sensor protein
VSPRRNLWLGATALSVVVGLIGSFFGAQAVARNDAQRSQQAFQVSAMDITSTLKLAIEREQDLAMGAGAFFVGNPNATQAEFHQWTQAFGAFERFPEVLGLAEVAFVPASDLIAFEKRAVADPSGPLSGTCQAF